MIIMKFVIFFAILGGLSDTGTNILTAMSSRNNVYNQVLDSTKHNNVIFFQPIIKQHKSLNTFN